MAGKRRAPSDERGVQAGQLPSGSIGAPFAGEAHGVRSELREPRGRCQQFDQAYAALITDLEKCGKLQDTLVVVATEFGRTPELKVEHNLGRDHHPSAFTCVLAGGGVKGGMRYGSSDASGNKVKDNMVTVQDFNATIAHALGIQHHNLIYSETRRPFTISDKGKPITSVFA